MAGLVRSYWLYTLGRVAAPLHQRACGGWSHPLGRGERGSTESRELLACAEPKSLRAPYNRLLGDAMKGDPVLFARQDEVEAAWEVIDPVLAQDQPVHPYEPHAWGPPEADSLAAPVGGWHAPEGPPPDAT